MLLNLASYNVHRCIGRDGRFDPDRIAAVLHELHADVIALQEIESDADSDFILLEELARQTGMQAIAGPTLVRERGHYGNALLTRLPIRQVRRIDLSLPRCEPRGALDVDLECRGRPLQVIVTHLGLRATERRVQIRQLFKSLSETDRCTTAVLGDINEWWPWSRAVRWLDERLGKAPSPATFPARYPLLALDRIWVRPRPHLLSVRAHISHLARWASDHLPVKAVIRLEAPVSRRASQGTTSLFSTERTPSTSHASRSAN